MGSVKGTGRERKELQNIAISLSPLGINRNFPLNFINRELHATTKQGLMTLISDASMMNYENVEDDSFGDPDRRGNHIADWSRKSYA